MKKIISFILLLGVLCLVGCSKEEPQSVTFLSKQFSTTADGETLSVSIEANCSWVITEQSDLVTVQPSSGNGNASIRINIGKNTSFQDISHIVSLTSEDGSSTDALRISQEKDYAVQTEDSNMINCEGGEFSVPVKSNDNINKVETPEWITFVESRSLSSYTYTFKAEPNQTGAVRKGTIKIIGAKSEAEFEVSQDSYEPISATMELPLIAELSEFPMTIPVIVEPEYADLSKLKVLTNSGTVSFSNGGLIINTQETDMFILKLSVGDTDMGSYEMRVVDSFDADSIAVDLPDTISISDHPHIFSVKLYPEFADASRISFISEGMESSFDGVNLSLTVKEEGNASIKAYLSEKEIYHKNVYKKDTSYPTSIEVDIPEELCEGKSAYKFRVYPENADASKLKVVDLFPEEYSFKIEVDSIYVDIKDKTCHPVLSILSNGKNIYYKTFKVISSDFSCNIEEGQTFVVNEEIELEANIPIQYLEVSISDESVLKRVYPNVYRFINEGKTNITVKNKLSGYSKTISVESRWMHAYAKIHSANSEIFDYRMTFEIYLRGLHLGPGKLYFENAISGSRILVTEWQNASNEFNFATFKVTDYMPLDKWTEIREKTKRYRLTYEGEIDGKYMTYHTDWEVWDKGSN